MSSKSETLHIGTASPGIGSAAVHGVIYERGGQLVGQGIALANELQEWIDDFTRQGWTICHPCTGHKEAADVQ